MHAQTVCTRLSLSPPTESLGTRLECHMHCLSELNFSGNISINVPLVILPGVCLKISRVCNQHATNQVWPTTIIVQELVAVEYLFSFPNQFIVSTCSTSSIMM